MCELYLGAKVRVAAALPLLLRARPGSWHHLLGVPPATWKGSCLPSLQLTLEWLLQRQELRPRGCWGWPASLLSSSS